MRTFPRPLLPALSYAGNLQHVTVRDGIFCSKFQSFLKLNGKVPWRGAEFTGTFRARCRRLAGHWRLRQRLSKEIVLMILARVPRPRIHGSRAV